MYTSQRSIEVHDAHWVGGLFAGVGFIFLTTFAYYAWMLRVLH